MNETGKVHIGIGISKGSFEVVLFIQGAKHQLRHQNNRIGFGRFQTNIRQLFPAKIDVYGPTRIIPGVQDNDQFGKTAVFLKVVQSRLLGFHCDHPPT